jgi:hypothetical protein
MGANTPLRDYYQMLADPCNAPLSPAPYAGMGSSLLVRTVDYFTPSVASGGSLVDFVYEFTPWNFPTGLAGWTSTPAATTGTIALQSFDNFVTNGVIARSYRPVAACLKWIPNGPISSRAGIVGMAYSPGKEVITGTTGLAVTSYLTAAQEVASNGSINHEVVWLPSFADERFAGVTEPNQSGCGSILIAGSGIDAAGGTAKGLLEMTIVWEWVPITGGGISATIHAPPKFTLQSVLASIRDVGKFVHRASHMGTIAYNLVDDYIRPRGDPFLTY